MVKPRIGSIIEAPREEVLQRIYSPRNTRELREDYDCWASDHGRDAEGQGYRLPGPGERSRCTARRGNTFQFSMPAQAPDTAVSKLSISRTTC